MFESRSELKEALDKSDDLATHRAARITQLENLLESTIKENRNRVEDLERQNKKDLEDAQQTHDLEMKAKQFELDHMETEELKKMKTKVTVAESRLAVVEKENEMLKQVVDINADIIDIKDLVSSLIKKLPSIDLKTLTIQQSGKS